MFHCLPNIPQQQNFFFKSPNLVTKGGGGKMEGGHTFNVFVKPFPKQISCDLPKKSLKRLNG